MQIGIVPPSGRRVGPNRNQRIDYPAPDFGPKRMGAKPGQRAVGTQEGQSAIRVTGNPPTALMHQPMVKRAQQNQVAEIGGPTLGPVHQVVSVHPASSLASGKTAALVTMAHLTGQPWGHTASRAPDTLAVRRHLHPGVAGQAPGGVGVERRTTFHLGTALGGDKSINADVHNKGGAIGIGVVGQTRGEDLDKGVGTPDGIRIKETRRWIAGGGIGNPLQRSGHQGTVVVGKPAGEAEPAAALLPPPAQRTLGAVRHRIGGSVPGRPLQL